MSLEDLTGSNVRDGLDEVLIHTQNSFWDGNKPGKSNDKLC